MNRRESLKSCVVGLLAPLAFLLPGKVAPKAKFPRFFAPLPGWTPYAHCSEDKWLFTRVDTETSGAIFYAHSAKWKPGPPPHDIHLPGLEHNVRHGVCREITAVEAEALLKPKRIVVWKGLTPGRSSLAPAEWDSLENIPEGGTGWIKRRATPDDR